MFFGFKVLSPIKLYLSILLLISASHNVQAQSSFYYEQEDVPVVILSALDKITTQLSTIEIRRDQMVRFGTLEITLRQCRTNPPEETPESVAFLEIMDV